MSEIEEELKKKRPFVHHRISTSSFRGQKGDAAIRVPAAFKAAPGAQLSKNCRVGRLLGAGIQGQVHQLEDDAGRPLDLVLKSLPRGPMAWGLLGSMEREWAVGHRLALHCSTPAGLHPGFMHVGAALVVAPAARGAGRFRGMVLERLNGHTMAAALGSKRSGVQDVHYIRAMLFQVLTALAEAQKLGFRHWDLRLKNIMEHHPHQQSGQPAGGGWEAERPPAHASLAAASQAEGQEDRATAMQTTAGHGVTSSSATQGGAHDTASSEAAAEPHSPDRGHDNHRPGTAGAQPGSNGTQWWDEDQGLEAGDCMWKVIDYGHADFGDRALQDDAVCLDGPVLDADDGLPQWMLQKGLPGLSFPERCYRLFWHRKGDVYRMLMSLQNVIDGSTWLGKDARLVHQLIGLIHHVTGKRLSVYYADDPAEAHGSCGLRFWRRSNGCCHFARRGCVRVQSFVAPYNPGITAAEALTAPFFTRIE